MSKEKQFLDFIKSKGKVSTGEICDWKAFHKYDRGQRTCRDNKDLIECRKMTQEEIDYYKPTGSAKFMYVWLGEPASKPIQQEMFG